jgi:hypothetical protein
MMNGDLDLEKLSVMDVVKRGFKKMLVELTSVKFLLLVFIAYLTAQHLCKDSTLLMIGVGAMLLLVGIKEGVEILKGKIPGQT